MKNNCFIARASLQICYNPPLDQEEQMRVTCPHCSQKALITARNKLSDTVTDIYCQCIDTQHCGASFVASLALKHTLNPPVKSTQAMAVALLMGLPVEEKQAIQRDLFGGF